MILKELRPKLVGQTIVKITKNKKADEGFEIWVKNKDDIIHVLKTGFSGEEGYINYDDEDVDTWI